MSRFYSYINSAKTILQSYEGEIPFALYLKQFFSSEKKYGSKDRKQIASLCYNFFRTGFAFKNTDVNDRIIFSHYLCTQTEDKLLQTVRPDLHDSVTLPPEKKLQIIQAKTTDVFPFNHQLSPHIDVESFNLSFLIQPDVFIRIRPGQKDILIKKLNAHAIQFREVSSNTLAFAPNIKLSEVIKLNKEAVIQDLNSQKVGELLQLPSVENSFDVWDCCAASGGKSIMAIDTLPTINLTVSDIRETIIRNLKTRLAEAGIKNYRSFVADLNNSDSLKDKIKGNVFDLILCDAPCSGSGTWARTPEQLLFFNEEKITSYSQLQKDIALNTIPYLKKNGYLLYITCSVFYKENEEVVDFIKQSTTLKLVEAKTYIGYHDKADTMFAALFQNK